MTKAPLWAAESESFRCVVGCRGRSVSDFLRPSSVSVDTVNPSRPFMRAGRINVEIACGMQGADQVDAVSSQRPAKCVYERHLVEIAKPYSGDFDHVMENGDCCRPRALGNVKIP